MADVDSVLCAFRLAEGGRKRSQEPAVSTSSSLTSPPADHGSSSDHRHREELQTTYVVSTLPANCCFKNTQNVKQNAFQSDKTRRNAQIFEGILFFKATNNIGSENKETNESLSWCLLGASRCMCARLTYRCRFALFVCLFVTVLLLKPVLNIILPTRRRTTSRRHLRSLRFLKYEQSESILPRQSNASAISKSASPSFSSFLCTWDQMGPHNIRWCPHRLSRNFILIFSQWCRFIFHFPHVSRISSKAMTDDRPATS